MCGIAGWFCQGDARPNPETVKGLLLANMERGLDATGVAWREGKKIRVRKSQGPADEFIKANDKDGFFQTLANSPIGLLHARATSKGNEKENLNNHPVVYGTWAVTHNGTLTNDDDVWEYYTKKDGLKRPGEVDTSAIPLVLSRGNSPTDAINQLSILAGSCTMAAWNSENIEQVILYRHGHHDLHMFYDEKDQILYWSSSGAASYLMKGAVIGRHKFLAFSRLADDHAFLLEPGGFAKTRVFKLEMRPFFLPVKPQTPPAKSSTTATGSAGTSTGLEPGGKLPIVAASGPRKERINVAVVNGTRRVTVEVDSTGHRQMKIIWSPIDADAHSRPWPMDTTFTPDWWNLPRELRKLQLSDKEEVERSSAYGLWRFKRPEEIGGPYRWEFKPYKRTKDWWETAYRTRFTLPFKMHEEDGKQFTDVDTHWAWEHYNLQYLKTTGETGLLLGFCCPWCGAWQSSVQLQHNKNRCEFCHVENRIDGAMALPKEAKDA